MSKVFVRIARDAGLKGFSFHSLRHTHASLLSKQGEHPKVVQERLGHATIGVTLDTYSHVLPGLQAEAVERFGQAFSEALRADSPSTPTATEV